MIYNYLRYLLHLTLRTLGPIGSLYFPSWTEKQLKMPNVVIYYLTEWFANIVAKQQWCKIGDSTAENQTAKCIYFRVPAQISIARIVMFNKIIYKNIIKHVSHLFAFLYININLTEQQMIY